MVSSLHPLRLTAAEGLAYCFLQLFPHAQMGEGGATPEGFFFDFETTPLDNSFLPQIEEALRAWIKADYPLVLREMVRSNARELFKHCGQQKKAALLKGEEEIIPIVQIGDFFDSPSSLPLLSSSGQTGSIKIINISTLGSQQIRITGIVQKNPQELKKFLKLYEAHRSIDYHVLGPQMRLFSLEPPIWLPNGVLALELLETWWKKAVRLRGFPLYKTSLPLESILAQDVKFLPKYGGLFNETLLITLCKGEQIEQELISYLQFFEKSLKIFDLESQWYFLFAPGKGGESLKRRHPLAKAAQASGLKFIEIAEAEKKPRIELRHVDPLGRNWVLASLKVEEREDLEVIKGNLLVSLENFLFLLLEHFKGKLPLWLAPEQVRILAVGKQNVAYASGLLKALESAGFRVTLEDSEDKLSSKVHAAEIERIPYIVIVGDKERKNGLITVRSASYTKLESFLKELGEKEFPTS